MAKKSSFALDVLRHEKHKKVTSIGRHATRSIPKNKSKRRSFKRYRGQGK